MNETYEFLKKTVFAPEVLFSAENPVLQVAGKVHRGLFETLDNTARANLSLAADLLDLNRRRMEEFYSGKPLTDKLQAQADLLLESGQRFVTWTDELRDATSAYRATIAEVASEAVEQPAKTHKASRKTAKAA